MALKMCSDIFPRRYQVLEAHSFLQSMAEPERDLPRAEPILNACTTCNTTTTKELARDWLVDGMCLFESLSQLPRGML